MLTWRNGFIKRLSTFDCCKSRSVLLWLTHASLFHISSPFLAVPVCSLRLFLQPCCLTAHLRVSLVCSREARSPDSSSCFPIAVYGQALGKAYLPVLSLCWKPATSVCRRGAGRPVSSPAQCLSVSLLRNRLLRVNQYVSLTNGLQLARCSGQLVCESLGPSAAVLLENHQLEWPVSANLTGQLFIIANRFKLFLQ